jgi:hypothetical protein
LHPAIQSGLRGHRPPAWKWKLQSSDGTEG